MTAYGKSDLFIFRNAHSVLPFLDLLSPVPARDYEYRTGEEARFEDTDHGAQYNQDFPIVDEGLPNPTLTYDDGRCLLTVLFTWHIMTVPQEKAIKASQFALPTARRIRFDGA
jgi:hypothetical protein